MSGLPSIEITIPVWLLSAIAPSAAVVLAWWLQHRELKIIHQNTNSQLSQALAKIAELQEELQQLKARK